MFDASRFVGPLSKPSCLCVIVAAVVLCVASLARITWTAADEVPGRSNLTAWGGDHVGQKFPEYLTGDECLFCHRQIGPAWNDNRHQQTIRTAHMDDPAMQMLRELTADPQADREIAEEVEYLLGSQRITRFLRRSRDYGKLGILSTSYVPKFENRQRTGRLNHSDSPGWNTKVFADRCAGCHATAVDAETRAFTALSIDCFSCHGDVGLEHTKDVSRVLLSSKSRDAGRVTSTCGQCHLRGGSSKSSGLPYPNTFVPGDNLFRDFQVDFSDAAIQALPAIEQHIYRNARDVAVSDRSETTCLTCHDVHRQRSDKHQRLETAGICSSCHVPGTDNGRLREALLPAARRRARSRVCEY